MSASHEEQRRRQFAPCSNLYGALLDEASEWSDPCTGTDHDDRRSGVVKRQVERVMARFDIDVDMVPGLKTRKEVRCDS